MTEDKNDIGYHPAFPVIEHNNIYAMGLNKRDWFAGMALQGMLAAFGDCNYNPPTICNDAYNLADEMIKAGQA